jgi:rhamnogalacturonan endolyase
MKQCINFAAIVLFAFGLLSTRNTHAARYMEKLDRGVVAVYLGGSQVYVGWRMFGTEPISIGYNVYRGATKLNASPITGSTNYVDNGGSLGSTYRVAAVIGGNEKELSDPVGVWNNSYPDIPLQRPTGGTTPTGEAYSYSPGDCSVGDLTGDGTYEIVVKWDPSNQKDNAQSGYTGNVYLDAYKLDGTFLWRIDLGRNIRAGAHYTQFMVYDLDSDGIAEVACKTAPGTIDGTGNFVLMPGDNPNADYRNSSGYILSGPEYLTVFNGRTGAAMATTHYVPPRGTVSQWGDNYGNRVDRFLAAVAYLDGERPSLVMCRGYYTRTALAAWDWRNGELTQRWVFDTGHSGGPWSAYKGQGNHNLSVGDVDRDGRDEIAYGGCTIDDDGRGLYTTGLGHGDAMHLADMDPSREGLEIWRCIEWGGGQYGAEYRDAGTGEVLFRVTAGDDTGRACAGDIRADYPGYEMWASTGVHLYSSTGADLGSHSLPINFMVWWDGDLLREFLNGTTISKYGSGNLLSASGCYSNNGSKSTPCLSADILGDWREEVIWRTSDNRHLRIYTTTHVTPHRLYTLMHDPQYRLGIAWQNVGYNQPPHPGFFLGHGMAAPPVPDIILAGAPAIYGDFDQDGWVDMDDLLYFVGSLWLGDFRDSGNCTLAAELDLNDDCAINNFEFSALAGNWTGPDTVPPSAPGGLSAFAGNGTVSLNWLNNTEKDFDRYKVYRSITRGSGYTQIAADLKDSEYIDNAVINGMTYYYVVTALDTKANESDYSLESRATPVIPVLVAHYELDNNGNDSSGNANHAVATGAPAYTVGCIGQAIDLDGSDDFLTLPTNIANSDNITIAAWVNWDGGGSWQRIFDFGNNTTEYMFLTPRSGSDTLRFSITIDSSGGQQFVETSQLAIGQWVHVAVKLERNMATLYVNGLPAATKSITLKPTDFVPIRNYIGKSQWPDPLFDGRIDDFRIYNYALSDSEIRNLGTDGNIYPVESALYGGGCLLENNNSGFMGTGFINFPTSGGYLEFRGVDGGDGGGASLNIRYALGATDTRTGNLIVNGVSQSITFDSTGAWTTWAIKNMTITLNSGTNNTIRFESTGQDLANIDEITVIP